MINRSHGRTVWKSMTPRLKRVIRAALREEDYPIMPIIHQRVRENACMAAYIAEYGRTGTLLIEYGYRRGSGGCSSHAHVPANVPALKRWIDQLHEQAEGEPVWWRVIGSGRSTTTHAHGEAA